MGAKIKEIVNYFERMINANSSILEFLIIKYLSKEYMKGFNLAKKKDIERAQFIFSYADMSFVKLLPSDNFAYHYMQTFAMSTKSYLAFKRKNSEEALEMSLNSINHALALKSFEYAEIMGLFISQAFMNIAKVHLYRGYIKKWRSVTIDNIDFLLNHKMPANVVNYEGILNKISDKLKYFMLMGVVDDLIINILKNDFKEGYNIIEQVQVRDISIPINKQIQDWVILNIGISKGQVGNEFKKDYHTFMKSSNDIANLTSMKLFLRNRIKKKFKYIYQELNVK